MDRRRKQIDPEVERVLRDAFYRDIDGNRLPLHAALKAMRRLSRLTQAEFARHRGISLVTLKQLESGKGHPKVDTLNKVAEIFGLELAFVRKQKSWGGDGGKGTGSLGALLPPSPPRPSP